jgi:hypothetical protein
LDVLVDVVVFRFMSFVFDVFIEELSEEYFPGWLWKDYRDFGYRLFLFFILIAAIAGLVIEGIPLQFKPSLGMRNQFSILIEIVDFAVPRTALFIFINRH